jgi:hypothetical protein
MGWMVNSTPWPFYYRERDPVSFYRRLCGTQCWSVQVQKYSPPTGIWSVDRPACSCLPHWLSCAGPLLMSFGGNETTSHPLKHLHMLYRLGVLIGCSAYESAVVSWCLTGEIAVVAPHWDTIVLLRDQGHLSCKIPYTRVRLRGFHVILGSGRC